MSEHVREYQRVSNAQATMTWSSGDRIDAQVATDFWEGPASDRSFPTTTPGASTRAWT